MKVKDTMREGAPGAPAYTKFVQNKVLGESACWALSLHWITSAADNRGAEYLAEMQTDDVFKAFIKVDQAKLIRKAGQDDDPWPKNHQQGKRLTGLKKDGGIVLKRFAPGADPAVDFYAQLAGAFANKVNPARAEYFVIANVRFQQKGGLGHAMAGHFHQPGFTYFDPNGGVLRFPFAHDFTTWFQNRFKLATESDYDKIAIAEFDYYIR